MQNASKACDGPELGVGTGRLDHHEFDLAAFKGFRRKSVATGCDDELAAVRPDEHDLASISRCKRAPKLQSTAYVAPMNCASGPSRFPMPSGTSSDH